jgi:MFS family permease
MRTLGLVTIGFAACVAACALAPGLAAFVLLSLPLGAGSAMFTAVTQSILQQGSAAEYQGRVMSLFTIAWMGTTPIGGLLAGVVIDAFSARAALGMGAVAALLAGIVALGATRTSTHHSSPAEPPSMRMAPNR